MSGPTTVQQQPHPGTDPRDPGVRLARLLDSDSLSPISPDDPTDAVGVKTVSGRIHGLDVIAYCTDATRMGGSLGNTGALRIRDAIDMARERGWPVLGLWHSGGAKLAEGIESMDGVGRMFAAMTRASGVIPQVSVVLGPAAGAAAYGPALTDVIVMSEAARVFVTGPDVVHSVTGEQIDMASLGGPDVHGPKSGVAHVTVPDEHEAFARARALVGLLGRPGTFDLERTGPAKDLAALLPASSRRAYDIHPVLDALLDPSTPFEEMQPRWAPNIVVGVGRLTGATVGVIANNPLRKGGCLDSLSAEKASRFVRMCDSLGIPLLLLVDVPGYLPGVSQEWGGVVRRGAKLLHAFAAAVVPRVTLILRKSYGGAYIAMNSRSLGATAVYAWPGAEVAVMGAAAAVGILHRKRLAAAAEADLPGLLADLIDEHRARDDLNRAVGVGAIDEVIAPDTTRYRLAAALASASPGRGRHGNIPL